MRGLADRIAIKGELLLELRGSNKIPFVVDRQIPLGRWVSGRNRPNDTDITQKCEDQTEDREEYCFHDGL